MSLMEHSRRWILVSTGSFVSAGIAGCLESDSSEPQDLSSLEPDQSRQTIHDIAEYYPAEGMGIQTITAYTRDGDPPNDSRSLSELEPAEHREAILAITRETYYPVKEEREEGGLEGGNTWVEYGDTVFGIEIAVGSRNNVVEFDRVLTLDSSLTDGELTLRVQNVGQEDYELGHVGRPHFGILLAWDGEHQLLGNEYYKGNEDIITDNGYAYPAWTNEDSITPNMEWSKLSPEDSIEEKYIIPDGVGDSASIYIEVPYRRTYQNNSENEDNQLSQRVIWIVTLSD